MNSNPDELSSLRRVLQRGAFLLLPFLALQFIELFVLPIDFVTFRVWEAALATPYRYPGSYYPNLHVRKAREYGDRYREGDQYQAQSKPVEWFVDRNGMRNRPEVEQRDKYDIVVLGDSNIVGSYLDQKDTLTEVLSARSGKTAYSYSIAHDIVSLFFNDPRLEGKPTELLVVESKLGNWTTNNSSLINFRELPDGSLGIVDMKGEFERNFHSPMRNLALEQLDSRVKKQAMYNWFRASLATDFAVPKRSSSEVFVGQPAKRANAEGTPWRPLNWTVSGGALRPLSQEPQPALESRATGLGTYWHSEQFVANRPDGKITVRFDAKNSASPSRHRLWIFEDGSYRSVGEIVGASGWRTFEIPITTNPGSVLEFQIDQPDTWQWLALRDVQVIGGRALPMVTAAPAAIPMSAWSGNSVDCDIGGGTERDCRQWAVAGKKGYVQTPILPPPGEGGMLIRFEARSDRPATAYSAVYLFEGARYLKVAQYAFGSEWREYSLLLKPDRNAPLKVQVDFPEQVEALAIRNFRAVPVERLNAARGTK